MGVVHAGLAKHGMAWFAMEQTLGKGQRGKSWESLPGENILLSVVFQPAPVFFSLPFLFNALIANTCRQFLEKFHPGDLTIKWPNDLYIGDRKAGGILIENSYSGKAWKWSVAGIGMNINQETFSPEIKNPVSVRNITGFRYDVVSLANELHQLLLEKINGISVSAIPHILDQYNSHLFKRNRLIRLRKQNIVFETTLTAVNEHGQLLTADRIARQFEFGEVEWILE